MKTITEKLRSARLKVTPQRLAVYNALLNTNKHPNAETIYRTLIEDNPSMSLATVYKTLDTLRQNGLIQEINVGEDSFRYDGNNMPHAHMICTSCRGVFDAPLLENMMAIRRRIAADTRFHITGEQVYFYGKCRNCQ